MSDALSQRPELSVQTQNSHDALTAVGVFDTLSDEFPDLVLLTLADPDLTEGTFADYQDKKTKEFIPPAAGMLAAAEIVLTLFAKANDGKGFDFDNATWGAIESDPTYQARRTERESLSLGKRAKEGESAAEARARRSLVCAALAVYVTRRQLVYVPPQPQPEPGAGSAA